jgi:hypothetical protein
MVGSLTSKLTTFDKKGFFQKLLLNIQKWAYITVWTAGELNFRYFVNSKFWLKFELK